MYDLEQIIKTITNHHNNQRIMNLEDLCYLKLFDICSNFQWIYRQLIWTFHFYPKIVSL